MSDEVDSASSSNEDNEDDEESAELITSSDEEKDLEQGTVNLIATKVDSPDQSSQTSSHSDSELTESNYGDEDVDFKCDYCHK